MLKGAVPFEIYGLEGAQAVPTEEFAAWSIGAITAAALAAAQRPDLLLVDFSELPAAFAKRIMPYCGLVAGEKEQAAILQVARHHSKRSDLPFEADSQMRQEQAGTQLHDLSARYGLARMYRSLRDRQRWLSSAGAP